MCIIFFRCKFTETWKVQWELTSCLGQSMQKWKQRITTESWYVYTYYKIIHNYLNVLHFWALMLLACKTLAFATTSLLVNDFLPTGWHYLYGQDLSIGSQLFNWYSFLNDPDHEGQIVKKNQLFPPPPKNFLISSLLMNTQCVLWHSIIYKGARSFFFIQ